jgi:hypothetical protein
MKMGVPVVATEIATEGMHAVHGHDVLIANTPEEFARQVVKVYTDCHLWQKIVGNAYLNINKWFSVSKATTEMLNALEALNVGPVPSAERQVC